MRLVYSNHRVQALALTQPLVVLNNWVVGNGEKVARARRHGQWFLADEKKNICATARELAHVD